MAVDALIVANFHRTPTFMAYPPSSRQGECRLLQNFASSSNHSSIATVEFVVVGVDKRFVWHFLPTTWRGGIDKTFLVEKNENAVGVED